MVRFLPFLIEIGLLVFCLVDCAQTDSSRIRNLPKVVWVLLIIVVPLVGGIGWLVAGRPTAADGDGAARPSTRTSGFPEYERPRAPRGPDDDPDFLRQIRDVDREHERTLRQWEDDLRERERKLRDSPPPDEPPAPTSDPTP